MMEFADEEFNLNFIHSLLIPRLHCLSIYSMPDGAMPYHERVPYMPIGAVEFVTGMEYELLHCKMTGYKINYLDNWLKCLVISYY